MAASKHHALMAVMFVIPVVCCFIGIGAFVHVTVAAERAEREIQAELRQQKLEESAELQQQLNALQKAAQDLRQKIAEVETRVAELTARLIQLDADNDTASALEEEIDGLKKRLAELLAESSALRDQIAQKQKEIDKLKDETKDADSLDEQLKMLRKELVNLQTQLDNAKKRNTQLHEELEELRRLRGEEEDKYEIRPSKPRPAGAPDPLFVECTPFGAIIQPEGTRLSDVPGDEDRSRFLAAGQKTGYVVFLVRSGSFGGSSRKDGSFERYRAILLDHNRSASLQIRFGFEPVEASWHLVYPGQEK
jgi:predicted  nucleic acid-binding Zn-ribbon protein